MKPHTGKGAHKVDVRIKPKSSEHAPLARPLVDVGSWFAAARHEMDSILSHFTGRGGALEGWRMPRTDIADAGDHYEVKVELPGIPKERIDVVASANQLEIRAHAGSEREEERKDYYYREIGRQAFYRSLPLPSDADEEKIKAEFADGCLRVTVPKRNGQTKGRRVPVD